MTIKFHDVSHYNGAYKPTGPTIAKATEGTGYLDPAYGGIRRRTLAGGWPFLPYHFLHRGNIAAQVDHAFAIVGHQPLMLDVESSKVSADSTLADVYAFADRWKTVTGQRVTLAYIPHWYWQGHWGSPSMTGLKSRGIGLISSNYTTYSDSGPGWNAYGGMTPIIWQYTSTPLDTNAFKGTTAELADLWANGTTTASHPSVPVVEDQLMDVILPASYGGDGKKTITAEAALASIMRYVLEARNEALAAVSAADPDKLAAAIVAKLPAGSPDVAAIKAALAQVLNDATLDVSVPAAG